MKETDRARTGIAALIALGACLQAPHVLAERIHPRENQAAAAPASAARALGENRLGMRFVEIPSGSFDMGSTIGPGEAPVHRVSVRSFWMGVTEVTQAEWLAVMGSNPSHFRQAGPNAPVEMVSWNDVQAFIAKLNALESDRHYRLPSEAEWEWACRGGSDRDPYGPPEEIAWVKENSGGTTHPVGLKSPNGFGLYDMFGNVPEWTQDRWHEDYTGAPADGSAWTSGDSPLHTLRGGGWDLPAFFIHAALRGPWDPIHRRGFRLVCVPGKHGVSRFIERGADIDVQCNSLTVPVYFAVLNNDAPYLEYLLGLGVDVDVPDFLGRTPLSIAVRDGRAPLVERLVAHGANPRRMDNHLDRSLLHLAAIEGHDAVVDALLALGLPVNDVDGRGWTPLDYASQHGHRTTADLLASRGRRAGGARATRRRCLCPPPARPA